MVEPPYVHRDVNWCDFNARVLSEAKDNSVPLLDRIKFMAIFSSNLDEFFRIKVAALRKLNELKAPKATKWLGYSPKEVLQEIHTKVNQQQNEFGRIWSEEILPSLMEHKIHVYQTEKVLPYHLPEIINYFRVQVQGYLHLLIKRHDKGVTLKNRGIYLVVPLIRESDKKELLGYVNIPTKQLNRFIELTPVDGISYVISLDDIMRINLSSLFSGYKVIGKAYSIKLNRDEDYEIEDEFTGNLVDKITEKINKRMEGDPVRFLYDGNIPKALLTRIKSCCSIPDSGIVVGGRYHNLNDFFQLTELLSKKLVGERLGPMPHLELERSSSVLKAIEDRDYLLHFPYHRYDYVLRFFNEAAIDPTVKEIKVTLYRISKKSQIAQALISAAQNGKRVTVFVEVKARYDELNNLQWAKEMSKAGVTIIYSLPGVKVHAKVALVVKQKDGKKIRYAYLATGNFNEKTALVYADHGLLTTHTAITKELEGLFGYLKNNSRKVKFKHLLVAGFNMKQRLLALIDNEIASKRKGKEAFVIIKVNGMDEREMIEKLYEASNAGVRIQLIVRAGCSVVPGVKGFSEHISAHRLVDMCLEHARVYWFCNGGEDQIYLSSADWMNRNLNRRIEVGFPVLEKELKEEIKKVVRIQLNDNIKLTPIATELHPTKSNDTVSSRAQLAIHQWIVEKEQQLAMVHN